MARALLCELHCRLGILKTVPHCSYRQRTRYEQCGNNAEQIPAKAHGLQQQLVEGEGTEREEVEEGEEVGGTTLSVWSTLSL